MIGIINIYDTYGYNNFNSRNDEFKCEILLTEFKNRVLADDTIITDILDEYLGMYLADNPYIWSDEYIQTDAPRILQIDNIEFKPSINGYEEITFKVANLKGFNNYEKEEIEDIINTWSTNDMYAINNCTYDMLDTYSNFESLKKDLLLPLNDGKTLTLKQRDAILQDITDIISWLDTCFYNTYGGVLDYEEEAYVFNETDEYDYYMDNFNEVLTMGEFEDKGILWCE